MAEEPIFFGNAQESGNSALAGASPLAMNVLIDGKGAVRRRPGLAAYDEVLSSAVDAAGIDGLHVTATDELLAVGAGRHIYRMFGGASYDLSPSTPEQLAGSGRPVFAENEVAVMIAGGNEIQAVDLAALTSAHLSVGSTDAPPQATHVIAHSQRVLCNDVAAPSRLRYSKTGEVDFNEFPPRYLLTAEAKPDPIRAVGENINEVWAWGADTTQLYVPDASSVYAPSNTLKSGLTAIYSAVAAGDNFAWLDKHKRFVLSDARSVKDISGPIGGTLDGITAWNDCFGYRIATDQYDLLVWTFPEDGRTWCYQLGGGWSQWQGRSGSNWTRFPVNAHVFRDSDKVDVVGLTDGRVCKLTTSAHTDLGDPIVAHVLSGYLSRGTDAIKECLAVYLTLQRGETTSTTEEPIAFLTWRDDGGDWEDAIPVGLGVSNDKVITVELRSLGAYRRRQWKLTFSGPEEWVLASVTENFAVGGN